MEMQRAYSTVPVTMAIQQIIPKTSWSKTIIDYALGLCRSGIQTWYSIKVHSCCIMSEASTGRLTGRGLESSTTVTHTGCPSMWVSLDFVKAWCLGSRVPVPKEKVKEQGSHSGRQKLYYCLRPSLRSQAVLLPLHPVGAVTNSHSDSRGNIDAITLWSVTKKKTWHWVGLPRAGP